MEENQEQHKLTREGFYTGVKVLFKYLGQYRRTMTFLIVMGVLSAIGNGSIPYITGTFFDSISSTATYDLLGKTVPLFVAILILWAIVQVITYIIDWKSQNTSEYISNRIWIDYTAAGLGYLIRLPMSFHKQNKIGDVGQKVTYAANAFETIAGRIVIDLAPQILSIVIAFIITFSLNPRLASVIVLGLVVYLAVLISKVSKLGEYANKYWKVMSVYWGLSYDVLGNTLAIKQATAEDHEQKNLEDFRDSVVPLWMQQMKIWSGLTLMQRMTILVTQGIIFIVSVYNIHQGTMTIGELIAFNAYAALIFGPFVTIARNWQVIQNGLINIQETEKILTLPQEAYAPKDQEKFDIEGGIVFKDVSFSYEADKPVLSNINFEAKRGEVIALVGESGVGKSTLIDLISAYHFPNSGKVTIDGHDIKKVNLVDLRSKIAVVPQEVVLFNDTIETNVRYGNFHVTKEQMEEAARKAHALPFIEKFPDHWKQLVGERGMKLSVGQKQRVAIARAILRNPSILILDEPTSALDAGSENIITKALEELMKGKTTFIIAHRLSTVRKANKILVFKEGTIVESGTHDELLKNTDGEYRRLYDLQIGLRDDV